LVELRQDLRVAQASMIQALRAQQPIHPHQAVRLLGALRLVDDQATAEYAEQLIDQFDAEDPEDQRMLRYLRDVLDAAPGPRPARARSPCTSACKTWSRSPLSCRSGGR
jgi:hypothetical protein